MVGRNIPPRAPVDPAIARKRSRVAGIEALIYGGGALSAVLAIGLIIWGGP